MASMILSQLRSMFRSSQPEAFSPGDDDEDMEGEEEEEEDDGIDHTDVDK